MADRSRRFEQKSYNNFNVAVYCPTANINHITDFNEFEKRFQFLSDHIKIGRVYLECYRSMAWCSKEQLIKVKEFFEDRGIAVSGGITTDDGTQTDGFRSLCYSDETGREILRKAVELNASVFDEFIFDDFYFLNCRCPKCIEKKGRKSWSEFRLEQKRDITENIVMKTAKEVNPNVRVIVKYPQWYEDYNETGYDLKLEPSIADAIYTGTETRNPTYCQQHLPKYLSYFIMRYLESAAPRRNLGGWFDPYECTYNLTSYLEQGYLTLFGKAKEITLFCLGSLMDSPEYQTFVPAVGQMLKEVDAYLGELGNPKGVAAYRPNNARGENNLHNYLGMCGIPFEPSLEYPKDASVIFLNEGAAYDKDIIEKMKKSLLTGSDVVVTSGFVKRVGEAFGEFVNIKESGRKAFVKDYADSKNNGVSIGGKYASDKTIIIPQMDYCTNDVWELAAAYGTDNNFPIVLRCTYGKGCISVITIPDDMGDVYHYPAQVLLIIRKLFEKSSLPVLDAPAGVQMFVYDNQKLILRSDLPYSEQVSLRLPQGMTKLYSKNYTPDMTVTACSDDVKLMQATFQLQPGVNYILTME